MKKILLAAALCLGAARADALCTYKATGLQLGIPGYNDSGSVWAACIVADLNILNGSTTTVAIFGSLQISTISANATNPGVYISSATQIFPTLTVGTNTWPTATAALVVYSTSPNNGGTSPIQQWFNHSWSEVMRVQDNGRVGVGTSSPGSMLDVQGSAPVAINATQTGTGDAQIELQRSAGTVSSWTLYSPSGSTDLRLFSGGDRVTFQSGGNVGIGTTAPGALLDINNGNIRLTDGNRLIMGASDPQIYGNAGVITFRTASTDRNVMDTSGRLGVGTLTPQQKLHLSSGTLLIDGNTDPNIIGYSGTNSFTLTTEKTAGNECSGTAQGDLCIRTNQSNGVAIGPNGGGTKVYITAAGNVGIGTTAPNDKFDVIGTIGVIPASDNASAIYVNNAANSVTRHQLLGNGNAYFAVGAGNVGIGTTSPASALEVDGDVGVSSTNANGIFQIGNGAGNNQGRLIFNSSNANKNYQIANNYNIVGGLEITPSAANGNKVFTTPTLSVVSANVGVSTNAPTDSLSVAGWINTTQGVKINTNSGITATCSPGQAITGATYTGGIPVGGVCGAASAGATNIVFSSITTSTNYSASAGFQGVIGSTTPVLTMSASNNVKVDGCLTLDDTSSGGNTFSVMVMDGSKALGGSIGNCRVDVTFAGDRQTCCWNFIYGPISSTHQFSLMLATSGSITSTLNGTEVPASLNVQELK